jgi:hypothetical protein
MKNFTQNFIGILALVFTMSFTVNSQEIGDIYEGGYIFQINGVEGLVADLQDLDGLMTWSAAINDVANSTSGGYDDWYLPSLDELLEMYSTIGPGADNVGNFAIDGANKWYQSSTSNDIGGVFVVAFSIGVESNASDDDDTRNVRAVRSVTFNTEILGCTDTEALNYNAEATENDGSCIVEGCMDASACNYNADANTDAECTYEESAHDCDGNEIACMDTDNGATDPYGDGCTAYNSFPTWCGGYDDDDFISGEMCCVCGGGDLNIVVSGCTDENAENYSADANTEDGSCVVVVEGCMDETAFNYDSESNTDDGSCVAVVEGCTDESVFNYDSEANTDDESCMSWEDLANNLQAELDNAILENGIGQSDIDAAFAEGVASVEVPECQEFATENIPLDLPQGWSMFGYTCMESVDAMEGFSAISGKIEIVKDEWGLSYLPSWGFNGLGSLQFSEGYQIKMIEEVLGFQFCDAIAGGASQEELDAAYTDGAASVDITSNDEDVAATAYSEGVASVTPEDGITQADVDAAVAEVEASYAGWIAPVYGCTGPDHCNYNPLATTDDGSCVYAQEGYDCDGNEVYHIGDQHAGGIVFQINEDGTGLVADLQDLGEMDWWDAIDAAESATSQGYDDWYLPSIEELELMYNTIGNGGPEGNIGGFSSYYYWSSSEYNSNSAWNVDFNYGYTFNHDKNYTRLVRIIRAF